MFYKEEAFVRREFLKHLKSKRNLLFKCLKIFKSSLYSTKTPPERYNEYCTAILAGHNLKSLYSAYDRLSKGYISDAETILKRILESLLAQIYFFENNDKAKDWVKGTKIDKLETNRKEIAKVLDKINSEKHIFPTDHNKFFEEYVYGVGYSNSNKIAHLDFDYVHREICLDNDPRYYSTTLVIGPKYDLQFMEITLNRIVMFSMFQFSYFKSAFKIPDSKSFKTLFLKIKKTFFE